MQQPEDDNRQFEQVLDRLDALMKRSHAAPADTPSSPVSEAQEGEQPPRLSWEDGIPLLTEIYEGAAWPANPTRQPFARELVERLTPDLHDVITHVLEEEWTRMRHEITARLVNEVTAALQQRALREDQTEI